MLLSPIDHHLQDPYDTYRTSYTLPVRETSAHMQHARDLALALLQRHYPDSQGYVVEPATVEPFSAKGVNFVLKKIDESDSDPESAPPK